MTQNYEHTNEQGSPNPDAEKWSNIGDNKERRYIAREEAEEAIKLATQELGSQLHDVWRESRKREDGSYEPRIKKTTDQAWIDKHGTNEVNIANTAFGDLPQDYQLENEAAAHVVIREFHKREVPRRAKDDDGNPNEFVLDVARVVHDEWLKRNTWAAGDEKLDKPFDELDNEEKDKDINQVMLALQLAWDDGDFSLKERDYSYGEGHEVYRNYNKFGLEQRY